MKFSAHTSIRPVRIAFAVPNLNFGGAARELLELVRHLDKSRYDIHVVALIPQAHHLLDRFQEAGVSIHLCRHRSKDPLGIVWFADLIRKYRIDLVHSFLPRADVHACMAGLLAGFKNVICSEIGLRRSFFPKYKFRYRLLDRLFTFRTAARIQANSRYSRQILRQKGCPEGKIWIVHNGIQLPLRCVRKRVGTPLERRRRERTVGMVSRLHPVKAPEIFADSAAEILKQHPDPPVRFILVGDGPLRDALETRIRQHGIPESFLMAGYQPHPEAWISGFDIGVLSSLSDTCPLSVMEYMAYGKPVVATAVGGVPELVEDGVTGLLVEPGNPQRLAEAILRLLKEPAEARQMGQRGYDRLRREFSMDVIVERMESLYRSVLRAPSRTSGGDCIPEPCVALTESAWMPPHAPTGITGFCTPAN